jgi:photosystem II stability/assembly factor-like uncharacterized protein
MFVPTVSPHDPNVVFVGCDMTGSYLTRDGGSSWRMFNLRDRTKLFLFDPVNPSTMYAYGLGLFRSTDAGLSWNLIYPQPADVWTVAIVGDHGDEAIRTKSGEPKRITALAVDPADSRTLYAGMTADGQAELVVSIDGAQSWSQVRALPGGARAIYIDPKSPQDQRTVAVVAGSRVIIRQDGTWREGTAPPVGSPVSVSGGFPSGDGKLIVYAAGETGAAVSRDAGATWESILQGAKIRAVAASLHHAEHAYVSYGGLRDMGSQFFGVAVTSDTGRHWSFDWRESRRPAPNVDQGGWINPTFGPGWGEHPLELGAGPDHPEICYATDLGRTLRTTDGGKTWKAVYTRKATDGSFTTTGLDVTTTYGVHFDPFNPRHMFITYTDIGLFGSDDGGASWHTATAHGVPERWRNTTYWVEFDPDVKGRLWAVMSGTHDLPRPKMWRRTNPSKFQGGICRSDDGGKTWSPQTNGMPETAATHILLDRRSPNTARVLYVTGFGRGVFKSMDGGQTWSLRNKGITQSEPFAWRLAQASNGTLYLILARRSEDGSIGTTGDGALYRSADGAESWQSVPVPEGVNGPNGLAIDPNDPERLYLAAWGKKGKDSDSGGGVFVSMDAGAHWKQSGLPDEHVYDVTIDPRNAAILFACGFESSAWRSSDRGATWTRLPGYNFKWGHRVIPDPVRPEMIYITTFGGSVWHGPATGDPMSHEDIATAGIAPGNR